MGNIFLGKNMHKISLKGNTNNDTYSGIIEPDGMTL